MVAVGKSAYAMPFMRKARIPRSVNGDEWRFPIHMNLKVAGFL